MNTFDVRLLSPQASENVDAVLAFGGEDASGKFGLRALHERFLTVLVPGLSSLRCADGRCRYLAQHGAVLHFADNRLTLVARDFLLGDDFESVNQSLHQRFALQDDALREVRGQLATLEREMLRRLWRLQREAA